MPSKTVGDVQDEAETDDMTWNNDWDDNDSTGALESQQIFHRNLVDGEEDDEIEDEIRANLSSKITSSLHAYKIAGIALIVTLISFTINTVNQCFLFSPLTSRNSRSTSKRHYTGKSHIVCCIIGFRNISF